jgi:hypothetical protein
MATVKLYEIVKGKRLAHVETAEAMVDANDEYGCEGLLIQMARRNRRAPASCELQVKSGRTTRKYRVAPR